MNPLQPLLALREQTQRQRDDAAALHARAQGRYLAAQQQNAQLLDYRKTYEQRWAENFQQGSRMELMHCYQAFTQRLALALGQQQQALVHSQDQVAQAWAAVQAHEMRLASVSKLIERRLHEQQLHEQRQDQKLTDEFAARVRSQAPAFSPRSHPEDQPSQPSQ